jgi:hypothetical protein
MPSILTRIEEYTDEEREKVVGYAMDLTRPQLNSLLSDNNISISGNKKDVRERLINHLESGEITYTTLVNFIDTVEPWGKQHVFLFDPPSINIRRWKNKDTFHKLLEEKKVAQYLDNHLPLILPNQLSLSSIDHSQSRLRITAVERRDSWEREEDLDRDDKTDDGDAVQYRAYIHYVSRGILAFEWNFITGTASLQISQLPTHFKYEDSLENFSELVGPWLNLDIFPKTDLGRAIGRFHELEENGTPETRSHGIDYTTFTGRRLQGRSASSQDSLFGEAVIDTALKNVRQLGTGHLGNFYFLPASGNPLTEEVHASILGDRQRVSFPTANGEEVVRYVLQRVRAACK